MINVIFTGCWGLTLIACLGILYEANRRMKQVEQIMKWEGLRSDAHEKWLRLHDKELAILNESLMGEDNERTDH